MTWRKTLKQSTTAATPGQVVSFSLVGYEDYRNHELSFRPSTTIATGTATVAVKSPGATANYTIGTLDLTDTADYLLQYTGAIESITFTPASFPAAKTYSLYLASN